jgi:predicted metal-dependent phosphoesterase TrpH
MRVELHCHSTCSDGTLAPAAIAARAAGRKVELFALTDHDTCAGTAEAVPQGARVLRATEVSCDDGHGTVHVLAFDTGGAWHELEALLTQVRESRRQRLRTMAERLGERGLNVDVEALITRADGRTVGRPDLARAMVEQGAVKTVKQAFDKHLYDGGPVHVRHQGLTLSQVLATGRAAGARLALAHPHLYGDRAVNMLRSHREAGLEAVEAWYAAYDRREREHWIGVARDLDLVVTGGSDFHTPGDAEPGVDLPEAEAARLLHWLSA